jgi:hypothetical protein
MGYTTQDTISKLTVEPNAWIATNIAIPKEF